MLNKLLAFICSAPTDSMNDEELTQNEARHEDVALYSGYVVLIGLVLEVVFGWFFHGEPWTDRWGGVVTAAIIAVGVFSEIHFGRQAGRSRHILQKRTEDKLALAVERANVLTGELEDARKEAKDGDTETLEKANDQSMMHAMIFS